MELETWDRRRWRGQRLAIEHPTALLHVLAGKLAIVGAGSAIAVFLMLTATFLDEPGRLRANVAGAALPAPSPASTGATPVIVTSTPTITPIRRLVKTGDQGIYLRRTPSADDRLQLLSEGAAVELLDPRADAGGWSWLKVRDAHGNVGWLPEQYLLSP